MFVYIYWMSLYMFVHLCIDLYNFVYMFATIFLYFFYMILQLVIRTKFGFSDGARKVRGWYADGAEAGCSADGVGIQKKTC